VIGAERTPPPADADELRRRLDDVDYLVDQWTATAL